MSSDGVGDVGEKQIRDQILRKYPSQLIQNITNIDYTDEATHDKIKRYIFAITRGQAPSARDWSMDFW